MGLLLNLLTLPASGPIRGLVWIAEKVRERAESEMYDEEAVRGELTELELRLDAGEINKEEYLETEEDLLTRLEAIQERRKAA